MPARPNPTPPTPHAPVARGRPQGGLHLAALLAVLAGGAVLGVGVVALAGVVLLGGGTGAPEPPSAVAALDLGGTPHHGPGDDRTAQDPGSQAARAGYAVWARDDADDPVRWDPCSPIELVVSHAGAPKGVDPDALRDDLVSAVEDVVAASGLDLVVVGTTAERPAADRSTVTSDGADWAPVLVGWSRSRAAGLPLRDSDRAIAVPVAVGHDRSATFVTGQIVLNGDRDDLATGRADRADTWGATLLHELGHLVGLDHVDDPEELMHRYPGAGPVALGPGDRAGLAALGAEGACRTPPPPSDLDVALPER